MRRRVLLTAFLSVPLLCLAQGRIVYTYDAAGNRTGRAYVIPSSVRSERKSPSASTGVDSVQVSGGLTFTVGPNPTSGILSVRTSGTTGSLPMDISLLTSSGSLVMACRESSATATLDLSPVPAGLYLLRVVAGGKPLIWKIIKK
ncbi:MAG: T9SS type A sorting domain-containing protein [Prevotella sp.]|nr:T9SS type A sorting domain-containing protein [Prevotella sp.]